MVTPRTIAIPLLAGALACGAGSTATTPPPAADATSVPSSSPDGPTPPMYKPSSSSSAPMPITDPAYGAFSAAPDAPGLGAKLPDFEVVLADGGSFSLAQARAAGPVLVMFYRGFW